MSIYKVTITDPTYRNTYYTLDSDDPKTYENRKSIRLISKEEGIFIELTGLRQEVKELSNVIKEQQDYIKTLEDALYKPKDTENERRILCHHH